VAPSRDPEIRQIAERLSAAEGLDPAELRELYPSVLILEALAIRESPPFDAAALAELRAANQRLVDSKGDAVAAAQADDDFHRRLTADCGNEQLLAVLDPVRRALLAYERVYMLSPERLARSARQHEEIVAALEQGDHELASERVRENYTSAMPELEARLQDQDGG
jgi:DNA-binding GntR family transcriptional regulator